jgi:hypothetical protein
LSLLPVHTSVLTAKLSLVLLTGSVCLFGWSADKGKGQFQMSEFFLVTYFYPWFDAHHQHGCHNQAPCALT